MKRILFCVFVLFGVYSFQAQKEISEISLSKSPLTEVENYRYTRNANESVSRAMHYQFSPEEIISVQRKGRKEVKFEIPTLEGSKILVLSPVDIVAGDYQLRTEAGSVSSVTKSTSFYQGYVQSNMDSKVTMLVSEKELFLMIYDLDGVYQINKVDDKEDIYAGYFAEDELQRRPIACQTNTQLIDKIEEVDHASSRSGPLECVEIYLEIDNKSYQENNSDVSETEIWALAIMTQVALFYSDSGIPIKVSGIKIYTSSDPYAIHGNASDMLKAFRDSMNVQGFDGRLAHLLSGREVGGGVAYVNVLCSNSHNQGVSGNLTSGGTSYGTYTWNIGVIAHELGHNFGSHHTHDCVWDTDGDPETANVQIDDCGNVYDPASAGACYDSNDKILPGNQGTIMSYCHAAGGGAVNLNLGFHPLVRDHIYERFINSNCGGDEDCSEIAPVNNRCQGAISLIPTISCHPTVTNNVNATSSDVSPSISCGNSSNEKDVWFKTTMPSNGKLKIETSQVAGGITDPIMEIYQNTCNNLTMVACDDNSGNGHHAQVDIDNIALADEEVLIRIIEKTEAEGEFGICVYSPELPCRAEVDSLISFYSSMDGPNWINKTGWEDGVNGSDCDYCNWEGITCDEAENIVQLSLNGNNLSGTMNNSLDDLTSLFYLNLSGNNISGEIPDIWTTFSDMTYLNLKNNNFSGPLPLSIGNLSNIGYFNVSNNQLSGKLLESIATLSNLQYLNLSSNNFTGCFPYNYVFLCSRNYINLSHNSGLPNDGVINLLCSSNTGADYDKDGFCRNIDDCNDFDSSIYDGAEELCDGKDNNCDGIIDDGVDHGPNVWIGPGNGGSWNDVNSWSKGHMPKECEDVEVGMNGDIVVLDHAGGQDDRINQTMRSLCIGPNTTIDFGEYSSISFKGLGYIINQGTLDVNGFISLLGVDESRDGIVNSGVINVYPNRSIYIKDSGKNGIYNKAGGVINNAGFIDIDGTDPTTGLYGIRNESIINNSGNLSIYGMINLAHIYLSSNSQLHSIGENAQINLSNFPEEGN